MLLIGAWVGCLGVMRFCFSGGGSGSWRVNQCRCQWEVGFRCRCRRSNLSRLRDYEFRELPINVCEDAKRDNGGVIPKVCNVRTDVYMCRYALPDGIRQHESGKSK